MIETCFQVLPGRGQVRALRAALRPPWNASSLLIGRHSDPSLSLSLSPLPSPPLLLVRLLAAFHSEEESLGRVFTRRYFDQDRGIVRGVAERMEGRKEGRKGKVRRWFFNRI